MGTLIQDLNYGVRQLRRNPGFTVVCVLSLALGIGVNTTMFSLINAIMFKPPAVTQAGRLVEMWSHYRDRGTGVGSNTQLSFPDYDFFREHNHSFSSMGAFTGETSSVVWRRGSEGETLQNCLVSSNFFDVLGVKALLGRTFLPDEDQSAGGNSVAVVSHGFWQARLGADPNVLGKMLTLNGKDFAVVGVAPKDFTGVFIGSAPDVWTPMSARSAVNPGVDASERHMHWLIGVARLKPGVSLTEARADLATLGQQLAQAFPDPEKDLEPSLDPVQMVPGPFREVARGASLVLMTVVGLILLIACANTANLLLAKASGRAREMATRAALGAGRQRLIRQALTESVLIAGLAGAVGLAVAAWAAPLLVSLKPAALPISMEVSVDARVLIFTVIASILTGIIFGLAPALRSSKFDLVTNLKDGAAQGGAIRSRVRSLLVVSQVSVCVVLLVGAGLCLRSLLNARSIDPGFDTRRALAATLDLQPFGYTPDQGTAFYGRLLERVRILPGVRSASLADHLPLGQFMRMEPASVDSQSPSNPKDFGFPVEVALVAPHYFDAMGIPLQRGRDFAVSDNASAPKVVIINQTMASRYWPHQDAVGNFVTMMAPGGGRYRAQIVGIAKDGKYQTLGEPAKPFIYRCLLQDYQPRFQLIVRTAGDELPLRAAIQRQLSQLDSRLVLTGTETLAQHMQLPLFPAQAAGWVLGALGALALLLTVSGLYGVISYSASLRTHEIGVRMALGAGRGEVLRMVILQGLKLTSVGVAIGALGALGVTRVLGSLLYGISPTDPISFGSVVLLLLATALVASYVPARRTTQVDPLVALRCE